MLRKHLFKIYLPVIALLLLTSACLPGANTPTDIGEALAGTKVAETVQAVQTQSAFETMVAQLTQVSQPTQAGVDQTPVSITPVAPSATPNPTATQPPAPTQVPPTAVYIPPTATPIPCNLARFVADVTIPDNTMILPGQTFTKTWRLMNAGSCTWSTAYDLVFVNGTAMNAPAAVDFPAQVYPGQTIDLSVTLTAPSTPGTYTGNWQLRASNGQVFGLGAGANKPFWVKIVVDNPPAPIDPNAPLDFAASYCSARWSGPSGYIPCPSSVNYTTGAVYWTNTPKLEIDYQDDEPAIITIPGGGTAGTISGHYPAVNVLAGDKFTALVGCLSGATSCDAMLQVNYIADGGSVQSLGSWHEKHEGGWTNLSIDLTPLAGKSVQFILLVHNNGSSTGDQIFWLTPKITR